jgi:hypothetical protein
MASLAPEGEPPEGYFCHPLAFPLLLLPWWMDSALGGGPDLVLQEDLLVSSMSGYYLIRLIDDVMDGSSAARPALLPAVGLYHLEFQAPYQVRFAADDPFWPAFAAAWAEGHEASTVDAQLDDLDEQSFARVAARKVAAGRIPLWAVARRHGLSAPPETWLRFFDAWCAWHQLHDDLTDWQRDAAGDKRTLLLCEGRRRCLPGETLTGWGLREGFHLGVGWLDRDLAALRPLAQATGSEPLLRYVDGRGQLLRRFVAEVSPGLELLRRLTVAARA